MPRKEEEKGHEVGLVESIEGHDSWRRAWSVEAGNTWPETHAVARECGVVVDDYSCEVGTEVVEIKEAGWRSVL